MNLAIQLSTRILTLVSRLNALSIEREAFDPLSDVSYKLKIHYPEAEGIHIVIDILYSSGGGMESSYAVNDKISFNITESLIRDIVFEQEFNQSFSEDLPLTEKNIDFFIMRIRKACESVLPSEITP